MGQSGSTAISNFHLDSDFIPVLCHDICNKDFSVQEPVKPAALRDREVEISNIPFTNNIFPVFFYLTFGFTQTLKEAFSSRFYNTGRSAAFISLLPSFSKQY